MPISEEELAKLNPKAKLVKKAIKEFGETFDCREAGYILEDGTMLDFSGKKEGNMPKTRNYDHREISNAFKLGKKSIDKTDAMFYFQEYANALAFACHGDWKKGHSIYVQLPDKLKPTEKQLNKVIQCCKLFEANSLNYDLYPLHEYDIKAVTIEKPDCAKAVQKMKADFEKAKKRETKM